MTMTGTEELLSIKEASDWATRYLGKTVTTSNISYLIQYGRIKKLAGMRRQWRKRTEKFYDSN